MTGSRTSLGVPLTVSSLNADMSNYWFVLFFFFALSHEVTK